MNKEEIKNIVINTIKDLTGDKGASFSGEEAFISLKGFSNSWDNLSEDFIFDIDPNPDIETNFSVNSEF